MKRPNQLWVADITHVATLSGEDEDTEHEEAVVRLSGSGGGFDGVTAEFDVRAIDDESSVMIGIEKAVWQFQEGPPCVADGIDVCPDRNRRSVRVMNDPDDGASYARVRAWFAALEVLVLNGNAVSVLWPLAGLGALRELDVSRNAVSALGPLSWLRALALDGNRIVDVTPLWGLSALEVVDHGGNRIERLDGLAADRPLRGRVILARWAMA